MTLIAGPREDSQRAKFMGPTWGPPGSCRPQMVPKLSLWTLLLGDGIQLGLYRGKGTEQTIFVTKVLIWIVCYGRSKGTSTHQSRDQMTAIFHTTFSNAFSSIKYMTVDYDFTEICSKGSNQQYFSTCSDNGLAPSRRQAIIWTNDG